MRAIAGVSSAQTGISRRRPNLPARARIDGEPGHGQRSNCRRGKQAKGAVKQAAGKALGDAKLVADGKSDMVEGKIQNAVGGLTDALEK